ncbi:MFS transporter [Methanospirillum sp.]|uniref:MFS transporter n=1 Tax=Methanospirillum sp. TaxID=45200 RepID=UPI002C00929E|nr:MFS transporter [Methanospirillum sp.]HOL42207.1 MFS transporter [Methanospirillum sp.]HPP78187.1 MFS transporter [Methanospirillum sp.]
MNRPIFLFCAVFMVMALSNAIVPVLPHLSDELSFQTLIFSAYFFGAMIMTLPAGIASDRFGQPVFIRISLVLTLISGIFIITLTHPFTLLLWRFIEGIGAGIFISSALSWIGYQTDTLKNTGMFMASLNLGLLSGLIGAGWLAQFTGEILLGVFICTILTGIISGFGFVLKIPRLGRQKTIRSDELITETWSQILRQYPLWISVIILLGSTGYVQAVFPELSGYPVHEVSTVLAAMNFATIITSLITPYLKIEPVLLIRISALMIVPFIFSFLNAPVIVLGMGAVAGLIMVSQIGYLALAEERQGIAMGLYSTCSYAGMTLLPALGGYIISFSSFQTASAVIALGAIGTAVIIGKCSCKGFIIHEKTTSDT